MFDHQSTLKRFGSQDLNSLRNTFDYDPKQRVSTLNGNEVNDFMSSPRMQPQVQQQRIENVEEYQLSSVNKQYVKKKSNQSVQLYHNDNNQIDYNFQNDQIQQPINYFQQPLSSPINLNLRGSQQAGNYMSQGTFSTHAANSYAPSNNLLQQMPHKQQFITASPIITAMSQSTMIPNSQINLNSQYYLPQHQRAQTKIQQTNTQMSDISDYDSNQSQNKMRYSQNLKNNNNGMLTGSLNLHKKTSTLPTEASDISYDGKFMNNRMEYQYQENQQLTNDLQEALNQSNKQFSIQDQINQRIQRNAANPFVKSKIELNSSADSLSTKMNQETQQYTRSKRESVVVMNQEQVENIQNQLDEIKQYLQKQNKQPKGNEYKQSTLQTDLLLNKIISKKKTQNFDELKEALQSVSQNKDQQNLAKRQQTLAQSLAETMSASRMQKSKQNVSKQKMITVPNQSKNQKNDNNNNNIDLNSEEINEETTTNMQSSAKNKLQISPKFELKLKTQSDATPFTFIKQAHTEREEIKKKSKQSQNKGIQSEEHLYDGVSKDTLESAMDYEEDFSRVPTEIKSTFGTKSQRKSYENLLVQLEQKDEQIKQLNKQILQHQQEQIQAKIAFESEKGQLKNEVSLLEGRLKQKEKFEEEKLKNDEILNQQQQVMKKNQEIIIQEAQQKNTQLMNDIQKLEKQSQEFNMQTQNFQSQNIYMQNIIKEKELLIEKMKKENQVLSNKAQGQMFNSGKQQQQVNDALVEQKSLKDQSLGNSGNMMGMQHNYEQIQKQYTQTLDQKERELKQLNGIIEHLNLKIKQYEEQFAHIATSDQQQIMMKQLQISKGTIEQLNTEIERYKQELLSVQQLSINVSACSSNLIKQLPTNQNFSQFKQNNDSDLLRQFQVLQSECDKLKANNDELKAKEADYEQSINKLKAGFYEESETRKELENKLKQITQKSNYQQYQGGESASKVVKELIQRKKNENTPTTQSLNSQMSSESMNDITILQEIIQQMTLQMNDNQLEFNEVKDKLNSQIKKLKSELYSNKQEIQKSQLEIKKLNKELEFSEIKETLNDREEEMSQMKQKNEDLQKQIKQIQEKHNLDRNQIIKENESYVDRLKKEYEERINTLKKISAGGSQQQIPSTIFDENKASELHTNCLEQINTLQNELTLCKTLYQKALNEEMIQTQQLINSLNNALLEKRDKIEKYEEQKGEMQTQITVFNSQCRQFQESLLTASMSVTLESSHLYRDGQGEILKTLIEKVKEKKKHAQEKANKFEKDNKKLLDENKKLQKNVREIENQNKEIEILSHESHQKYVILYERMKDYIEEDKNKSEEIQMLKSQLSSMSGRSQKLDIDSTLAGLNNMNGDDNDQLIEINSQSLLVTDGTQSLINNQQGLNELLPEQTEQNDVYNSLKETSIQAEQKVAVNQGTVKEYEILFENHEELQEKYTQTNKQLEEKLKSETIMQNMYKKDVEKRKVVEANYKNKQEECDKLEKLKKSQAESIKKLNQKNASNESKINFFEEQMKEYKNVIDKLNEQKKELEEKLKGKISNSQYHSKFMSQGDQSYLTSNMGSSIGESSVVDPDRLLNELNEKINENCQLNMKIDQLNDQIQILSQNNNKQEKSISGSSIGLKHIVEEKQQLEQQVNDLKENIDMLQAEIHQCQYEASVAILETSELKQKCETLEDKISEQQELLEQNLQQINILQLQVEQYQKLLKQHKIKYDINNQFVQEIQPQSSFDYMINGQQQIQSNLNTKKEVNVNKLINLEENLQNNDDIGYEDSLCQSAELSVHQNLEQKQKEANVLKDLFDFKETLRNDY